MKALISMGEASLENGFKEKLRNQNKFQILEIIFVITFSPIQYGDTLTFQLKVIFNEYIIVTLLRSQSSLED